MLEDHAKLLGVLHHAKDGIGRRKLQKIVYVLKKCNYPFHDKFHFHYYGPYSEEVTLRVQELCNLQFLHEGQTENAKSVYVLSEEGKSFLCHYEWDMPGLAACVNRLNAQSARFLELLAIVLHFSDMPTEEVEKKVFTLNRKRNYTKQDIAQAFQFFEKLKPATYAI